MKYFLLTLLFISALFATQIESIKFEGLVHLSDDVALDIIGLSKGATLDEAVINKGIKALYKQGYFKDIWVTESAGNLLFHCSEKPIISKITVKGFEEGDDDKRNAVLKLKKGQIYDAKSVSDAKKRIQDALEFKGTIDSVVEVQKKVQKNGSIELSFIVSPGKDITITSLQLAGQNKLDKKTVTSMLVNNEAESFGWFWGRHDGSLNLPQLKYDTLRMQDVYRQNGYLDVKIDEPLLRVNFNTYKAELSYQIHEGKQYQLKSVDFEGNSDIVSDEKIKKLIKLEVGKPFNIKVLREDMQRLQTAIADLGYAYARVIPDVKKDDQKAEVVIHYKIVPGEKVYIHDVIITGNDRTLDRVIRRDVYLAPGDLFNATDLKDSQAALGRTGYFESATVEQKRVSASQMDLIVHVKETATGNVQIGGGYGSYGGFSFDASISDRNIFGSGMNLALKLQSSQYTKQYSVTLNNPRINDSDYSGSMNLFIREFELIDTYNSKQNGASFSVGKRFTRTLTGNLGYRYIDASFSNVNPDANLSASQTEPYEKSSVSLSLSYNNTDDFYVPRSGFKLSDSFEYAGIGGNANFTKNAMSFSKYIGLESLLGFDMIFRYKANVRWIDDLGFVPLDEHFYMGGFGSVRGYQQYSLPAYVNSTVERSFYASKSFSHSLEVSMPLVKSARLRWAMFVDYGYLGVNDFAQEKRGGYGAQLEWFSPMGPIALVFANPFDNKDGDRLQGFEFSIGRPF